MDKIKNKKNILDLSPSILKWIAFLGFSLAVVGVDQLAKLYVLQYLRLGQNIVFIEGYVNWTYVLNPGAAFGFLGNTSLEFREIFFIIVPLFASIFILLILKWVDPKDLKQILALSSIFGGATGNFIDRVRFNHVIDFIDIHFNNRWSWPAFNIADVAIIGGVAGLLVILYQESKLNQGPQTPDELTQDKLTQDKLSSKLLNKNSTKESVE